VLRIPVATADLERYRGYFPNLKLLAPSNA